MVTKANLGNVDGGVRRRLVYQCAVKATVLADIDHGIFIVSLIKCRTVAKSVLGQVNATVVRPLANVSAVTTTGLANIQN